MALGPVHLDDEIETAVGKLDLAIIAKPVNPFPRPPTIRTIETMFKQHYHASPRPTEIFYFAPDFILQFNDKRSYDTILSYQAITDDTYTFTLHPWTDESRCQTQIWNVPVTIDIHGIPPHLLHIKSLNTLLDPYCDIEAYEIDKKTGICTVEGSALSVDSIPRTGYLSYAYRAAYKTSVHTFPVTVEVSLLTTPGMYSSVWVKIKGRSSLHIPQSSLIYLL